MSGDTTIPRTAGPGLPCHSSSAVKKIWHPLDVVCRRRAEELLSYHKFVKQITGQNEIYKLS